MGLFDRFKKPKWQHKNPNVRLEAIEELYDLRILDEMAENDSDEDVRICASKRSDFVINRRNLQSFEYVNKKFCLTNSIYDLGDNDVLIMGDKFGCTSWEEYNKRLEDLKKSTVKEMERLYISSPPKGSDDVKYISENFKNKNTLPNYKKDCIYAGSGSFLDPQDNTCYQDIYLCKFDSLKAVVISNLKTSKLQNCNFGFAPTISFNNCDFSEVANIEDLVGPNHDLKNISVNIRGYEFNNWLKESGTKK